MSAPAFPAGPPRHISLPGLEAALAALPRDATPSVIESNVALVADLGNPEDVCRLLESISSDDTAVRLIAGRSYRHVNHFDKIVLVYWWTPATQPATG
jgi:hypothetical protein